MTQAAQLGDYVWSDANQNGIQDTNETGINGVTVKLLRDLNNDGTIDTNEVVATTAPMPRATTTLKVSWVACNTKYWLSNPTIISSQPKMLDRMIPKTVISMPPRVLSQIVTLTAGEFNRSVDAGLVAFASLGDKVFHDLNANGIQDADELGIAGATVNLLDSSGVLITSTTTDGSGLYSFGNLLPGDYKVQFVQPTALIVLAPPIRVAMIPKIVMRGQV